MAKQKLKTKDYERLGRLLVSIYESGYSEPKIAYKVSFLKGILGGLGGVMGATIGVAVLIWILSLFDDIPLVGRFVESIQETINSRSSR